MQYTETNPHNPFRAMPPPLASIGSALESVSALALECEHEAARALSSGDALAIARAKARIGGAKLVLTERLDAIEHAHAALAERHNACSTVQALSSLAIAREQEAARVLCTGDPNEIGKARARVRGVQRLAAEMLSPLERARAALSAADTNGANGYG